MALHGKHRDVIDRAAAVDLHRAGVRRVVQHHGDLKQRRVIHRAIGIERLDQQLEWHVLIGVSIEHGSLRTLHDRGKRRIVGEIEAHHERIQNRAQHAFHLGQLSRADRAADGDVGLASVAREHDSHCRQQHHVDGRIQVMRQRAHVIVERRRPAEIGGRAASTASADPRPIGGECTQLRQAGQPRGPVLQPLARRRVVHLRTLPCREIGVLQRHRRARFTLRGGGQILGHDFLTEHPHRPGIECDMVRCQQHHDAALGELQNRETHRRSSGEIERLVRRNRRRTADHLILLFDRQRPQIAHRHRRVLSAREQYPRFVLHQ